MSIVENGKNNLYIVFDENSPDIKVGISVDPYQRSMSISEDLNYDKSVYYFGEERHIRAAEKAAHAVFYKHSTEYRHKHWGATEWFDATIYEDLLDFLQNNFDMDKTKWSEIKKPVKKKVYPDSMFLIKTVLGQLKVEEKYILKATPIKDPVKFNLGSYYVIHKPELDTVRVSDNLGDFEMHTFNVTTEKKLQVIDARTQFMGSLGCFIK